MVKKMLIRIVVCLGVLGFLGVFQSNDSASAALWARGTPKILRGHYQGKRISPVEGFGYTVLVTRSAFIAQSSNNPQTVTNHLFYQRIGNKIFRFTGFFNGMYGSRGRFYEFIVALRGNALVHDSYRNYKKFGIRKILFKNPAKRVRNWRNGGLITHY